MSDLGLFAVYALHWSILLGSHPPHIEAVKGIRTCRATTDGYGPVIQCDPSYLVGSNLKAIALHEVAHIKLGHPEDGRKDRARHGDPEFKALLQRGRALWP